MSPLAILRLSSESCRMQAISRALWYIESHFGEPLTLDDVARVSGLSRFHLARTFAAMVGQPVLAYTRGRRLSEAARLLADGAPDILQVALAVGYGSHEAFTRAFRDQFGLTPEEARARRSLDSLHLTEPLRMPDNAYKAIEPDRIVTSGPMLFAGIRKYFRFADRAGLPALWQAFAPNIGTMPGEILGATFGLCLGPADDDDGCGFDYMPSVQVRSLDDLPEGIVGVRIAGREWAIFRHLEHVSSVGVTCAAAGDWLAQSGRTPPSGPMQMIERYGPEFSPHTGQGGCEIWLPLGH
jgi:AraC family transcriptional regulator